jgi:hypothetical protein
VSRARKPLRCGQHPSASTGDYSAIFPFMKDAYQGLFQNELFAIFLDIPLNSVKRYYTL